MVQENVDQIYGPQGATNLAEMSRRLHGSGMRENQEIAARLEDIKDEILSNADAIKCFCHEYGITEPEALERLRACCTEEHSNEA